MVRWVRWLVGQVVKCVGMVRWVSLLGGSAWLGGSDGLFFRWSGH